MGKTKKDTNTRVAGQRKYTKIFEEQGNEGVSAEPYLGEKKGGA